MKWFYEAAPGQQQGPVTDGELNDLVAAGRITQTTLVWQDGMAEWQPLREVRPDPMPLAEEALPGPGKVRCSLTGEVIPESEAVFIQGKPYSAEAKLTVLQTIQQRGVLPKRTHERHGPPWEQRATLGVVAAAWLTIKGVLLQPRQTFTDLKRTGGIGAPLLFSILLGTLAMIVSQLYSLAGNAAADELSFDRDPVLTLIWDLTIGEHMSWRGILLWIALSPIIVVVTDFIYSGVTHLALIFLGAARQPFEATFRTNCYASGSTGALAFIPFAGDWLAIPYFLIAMCIGIASVHEISTQKAAVAVLVPTLAICGCGIGGALLFAATSQSSFAKAVIDVAAQ